MLMVVCMCLLCVCALHIYIKFFLKPKHPAKKDESTALVKSKQRKFKKQLLDIQRKVHCNEVGQWFFTL